MKSLFSTGAITASALLAASLLLLSTPRAGCQPQPETADESAAPFAGVLLLQNGGVVQGQISQAGNRWIVKNAGREIEVPSGSVEMACRSIEEAYEAQRTRLVHPTAEAHLKLADWCFRFDLFLQAERELNDARNLDPRNPRLAVFSQRLAIATAPRATKPVTSPPPAAATAPARATHAPAPTAVVENSAAIRQLSEAVVERFTRKVQPVLVNNCTAARCHQPGGAQKFQIDRALLHGMANRQSTMNNLTATLALVDHLHPEKSPLLTVPRTPHGGMQRPVFGPTHDQLVAHLSEWVAIVTEKSSAEEPLAPKKDEAANGVATNMPTTADKVTPAHYEEGTLAPPPAAPRYGAQIQPWRPKDAFDSEIFNRQSAAAMRTTRTPAK